jgi:hypothetical protein
MAAQSPHKAEAEGSSPSSELRSPTETWVEQSPPSGRVYAGVAQRVAQHFGKVKASGSSPDAGLRGSSVW